MHSLPRLLRVENEADARREILAVGADPAGAERMAAKMVRHAVKLTAIPCRAANILKQEMLALGGDAAVSRGTVACSIPVTDVILIGSLKTLRLLIDRLAYQPFGLADVGRDLATLMAKLDKPTVALSGRTCRLPLDRPLIMGILNVTPDSFSDGGSYDSPEKALDRARAMIEEGVDIIDVGGESTRPGAPSVSAEEEMDRVLPVIDRLTREFAVPLSVDTTKSDVARDAVRLGAEFVNDISGLQFDPALPAIVSETGAGLILMHTRGRPDRMQTDTVYDDLVGEVFSFLSSAVDKALEAGIPRDKLAVDPGIGFGKSQEGNLELLNRLQELRSLGLPILLGTSRKSFIGKVLNRPDTQERLFGTLATVALGVEQGANILRVHDVMAAREAALMAWAVCRREIPGTA